MTIDLVQVNSPSPSLDAALCHALRLCSVAPPRCYESASTTDVSRHEHPHRNTIFGACSPSTVGNPPVFDLSVSNDFVLDGTSPALGRAAVHGALPTVEGKARQLVRLLGASPFEPSDTSTADGSRIAKIGPFSHSLSPLSPGHVNAAGALDELEVPSIEEVRGQTLSRELVPERCHAWPVVAGAAPVHRCFKKLRLDSWPRRCSRALQGRVRFYDFCRRIFQRAQSRTARTFQSLDPENP